MPRRAEDPLPPLLGALRALESWLRAERIPHAYVGGLAVAIVGRPRFTKDIDAVLLAVNADLEGLLASAGRAGFRPRLKDAARFARANRVVLLRHAATGVEVDLSLGMLPFEEELVRRARETTARGIRIRVARPDDLVVMKAIAGRPRDMGDIEGLLDANPRMSKTRIRSLTAGFAELLESPEILEDLERLLQRAGRTRRRARPGRARAARSARRGVK